ncbi:MAG: HNH endonuclease [Sulfurimonas sp.]|nr:HNH endonuclease [Sulfurimonas sp.]
MIKEFEFIRPLNTLVSEEEIISDLKSVAKQLGKETVTQSAYGKLGKYDCTTVSRKFGTWNKALKIANLSFSNEVNISDERLYENILNIWQHFGRQPRRRDLTSEISEFSQGPYNRSFKTWTNALQSFVDYANGEDLKMPNTNENNIDNKRSKTTGRDPSLRLRYRVLQRDYFTCKQCGASPSKNPNVVLHIDHIIPWSKNGETVLENLQTLCSNCNLGKSNL